MNPEQLPGAILLSLICIVLAITVAIAGARFNKRFLKQIAVMIGVAPVLGIGLQLSSSWFGWSNPAEFRSATPGPASVEASVERSVRFPVNNAEIPHQLELTPKTRGDDPPAGSIRLRFKVRSAKGEIVAQGEQDLAATERPRWSPLRATFQPREWGEHYLDLEIPSPVGTLDVVVRELR